MGSSRVLGSARLGTAWLAGVAVAGAATSTDVSTGAEADVKAPVRP